jgi:hypothetical protein
VSNGGTVEVKTGHLWNAMWTAIMIIVGVGITGIIDERITNHPKVIETYQLVKEDAKKIDEISKTVIRLEVLLERNEKLMEALLEAANK